MDIEHMPPGFEGENNNIAIDFDGVIHEFKGWGDGTCYGKPLEGALEAIKLLSKKYNVIIFTAKSKPNRPLVEGKTGTELVWEWLKKHNIDQYIKEVTAEKPRACLYIDDKGFRFINWIDTLKFINSL
jgi:ribonucleotide monophosphatase NagD (HAD superfamily)